MLPFLIAISTGLVLGFAGVHMLLSAWEEGGNPIDLQSRLVAEAPMTATLGKGWGRVTLRGTVIAAPSASLTFDLPHRAKRDFVLEVKAGTIASDPRRRRPLKVLVNNQAVGSWIPGRVPVKRLLVSAAVANRRAPLAITFRTDAPAGSTIVQSLSLRDQAQLAGFDGNIDNCRGAVVSGWAKAGNGPAPIILRRGGRAIRTIMPSVERPDLPPAGHPLDAGFHVTLTPPIRAGEKLELVFPNGKRLGGAQCKS